MTELYGLIGHPLSHSFSKKYFTDKFLQEELSEHQYDLYDIKDIAEVREVIANHRELRGLNVTIPYKEAIIPFLDELDESAKLVGAVNVIKIQDNLLTGYNADIYGFETSLFNWLKVDPTKVSAIILGTGGAAKAVKSVLKVYNIPYKHTSRTKTAETITYKELKDSSLIADNNLIINTTPLGMMPNIDDCPDIAYAQLGKNHYVFDLIYNPQETRFLAKARLQGAAIKNGLEMLELQAEKSWEIWTA
jgi:shikimate dehydrogenase